MVSMTRTTPRFHLWIFLFLILAGEFVEASSYPVRINDSTGAPIVIDGPPQRVICLVPGITEILFELGSGDAIKGLTAYETYPPETADKEVVGGFLSPSITRIEALNPDVIFLSSLHQDIRDRFAGDPCLLIQLESHSVEEIFGTVETLGKIFSREEKAAELNQRIRDQLEHISRKVERIPAGERKRVMRFMGREQVMTPGDDSFQNAFIRAAGGIAPQLGKKGGVVEVTLDEWQRFNPQVIYGCGGDRDAARRLLARPGWKDVDAVRDGRIYDFPCELTCRASVHSGHFVAWLASTVYGEQFSIPGNCVLREEHISSKPVKLPLGYVKSARVDETTLFDFPNKTLIIDFKRPQRILSTLEGSRTGVTTVGNHGSPPQCWSITHRLGLNDCRNRTCKAIGKSTKGSSLLFTGASLENLAIGEARFRDLIVYALVTAGVKSNAVRMSAEEGRFYEPGTINIILMSNMRLTPRAMTRAIISATEAKSAAMQDLDVRSTSSSLELQATGTGTDELIVVEGTGKTLDNAGGHCKLGELIARAVYDGVRQAVFRQNGMTVPRNIFRRLGERGVTPYDLLKQCPCLGDVDQTNRRTLLQALEEILLQPRHAAFIESALALTDAHERGLVSNLDSFDSWCRTVAVEVAGREIPHWRELVSDDQIPVVLKMSLNALLNGLAERLPKTSITSDDACVIGPDGRLSPHAMAVGFLKKQPHPRMEEILHEQ